MNPEDLYPEIVSMKREEIFVEWAYIVLENFTIIEKIHIKEIVFEINGSDVFSHSNIVLPPVYNSCISWVDFDQDNDLDLFVSGSNGTNNYTVGL